MLLVVTVTTSKRVDMNLRIYIVILMSTNL